MFKTLKFLLNIVHFFWVFFLFAYLEKMFLYCKPIKVNGQ